MVEVSGDCVLIGDDVFLGDSISYLASGFSKNENTAYCTVQYIQYVDCRTCLYLHLACKLGANRTWRMNGLSSLHTTYVRSIILGRVVVVAATVARLECVLCGYEATSK